MVSIDLPPVRPDFLFKGEFNSQLKLNNKKQSCVINVEKILAVMNATDAVAKRKPEKIRLAGTRTLTSAIPVQRSNQLS